jgi:hypothetical protein
MALKFQLLFLVGINVTVSCIRLCLTYKSIFCRLFLCYLFIYSFIVILFILRVYVKGNLSRWNGACTNSWNSTAIDDDSTATERPFTFYSQGKRQLAIMLIRVTKLWKSLLMICRFNVTLVLKLWLMNYGI